MDFKVNDVAMGENGSELRLSPPGRVKVHVQRPRCSNEKPDHERRAPYKETYWHIERARVGDTREVPVEVIVNGYPVAKQNIVADGELRDLTFERRSSAAVGWPCGSCRRRTRIRFLCWWRASRSAPRDGARNGA